jgi:hypothetical protein
VTVWKKELVVGTLQVLLTQRRLRVAPDLPKAAPLVCDLGQGQVAAQLPSKDSPEQGGVS